MKQVLIVSVYTLKGFEKVKEVKIEVETDDRVVGLIQYPTKTIQMTQERGRCNGKNRKALGI